MAKDNPASTETPTAIISLLADAEVGLILKAAAAEPRSVAELVDECGIPSATAYRKINDLVEAQLLEEQVRIRTNGQNAREYVTREATVKVATCGTEGLDIACPGDPEDGEKKRHATNEEAVEKGDIVTDGGVDFVNECRCPPRTASGGVRRDDLVQ